MVRACNTSCPIARCALPPPALALLAAAAAQDAADVKPTGRVVDMRGESLPAAAPIR